MDAAQLLFAKNGYAGARVADIIAQSGASTGSFYHRFRDKRDLFDVMTDRYIADVHLLLENWDLSRSVYGHISEVMRSYAEQSYDRMELNRGFYKAAYEISTYDPAVWDRLKQLTYRVADKFASVTDEYRDQIDAEDADRAVRLGVQIITTLMVQTSLGSGPLFPQDKFELADVVTRAAMGVLR